MLYEVITDHRWAAGDLAAVDALLATPFASGGPDAGRLDLNRNGLVDLMWRRFKNRAVAGDKGT